MAKKQKNRLKKFDDIWAERVKENAGYRCEYCGRTDPLNSHHIFSRSNIATRWELDNGCCLCVGHHVFGTMSAHKAPAEFMEWIKDERGEEWYERLRDKARKVMKEREAIKLYFEID